MKFKTVVISITAAAVVGTLAGWWFAGRTTDSADSTSVAENEREILYWVAPMDPSFRRNKPGKSPMGMDLVPVYADEADASDSARPSLRIRPAVVNNIGVKTAPAKRGTLYRRIETVGFITPNEHLLGHVHVRAEGWIEFLAVHTEGAAVGRGEVLFQLYAPALVSAQEEFLQALRLGRPELLSAAEARLLGLGLMPEQIERLKNRRAIERVIDIRSPQDGYVMELNVRHGMHVTPELMIMSIADLSRIWVDVNVFENQIDWVEAGQVAHMTLSFAPDREWIGEVDYVYPTVRAETRTARVRLAFDNPDLALKPNMYAEVVIDGAPRHDVVHVPSQSVIRTGDGARVIVALGGGRFRPVQVRTGLESDGRIEIIEGLAAGEEIVVSSQFLIDSEASLDASLLRMLDEAPESEGAGHATDHGHGEDPGMSRDTSDETPDPEAADNGD